MGKTSVEKIISAHSGKTVQPGEFVMADVDLVFGDEISGTLAIREFKEIGVKKVFDPNKVIMAADHYLLGRDLATASQIKQLKDFHKEQGIKFYDASNGCGIMPAFIPEQNLVKAGDLLIGGNSHTPTIGATGALALGVGSADVARAMAFGDIWLKVPETIKVKLTGELKPWVTAKDISLSLVKLLGSDGANYMAVEFESDIEDYFSLYQKLTLCNLCTETGAKTAIFPQPPWESDEDASFKETIKIDMSIVEPCVALPFSPENVVDAKEASGIHIDQVYIGGCANGSLEDFRQVRDFLEGRHIHSDIRFIIAPSTSKTYFDAIKEGIFQDLIECGAVIVPAQCGACAGLQMGVLASGESCVATTNRNFKGRMGHPDSKVYLAGPLVAAASALTGEITDPREVK